MSPLLADLGAGWWAWIMPATTAGLVLAAIAWAGDRVLARGGFLHLRAALWLAVLARLCVPPGVGAPARFSLAFGPGGGDASLVIGGVETGGAWTTALAAVWLGGAALVGTIAAVNARSEEHTF